MPFSSYTVEACSEAIRSRNAEINALITVLDVPEQDTSASAGPLAGVPYVLKDTWDTAGIVTTGGSLRHKTRVPSVSSHAHRALRKSGAVLLGKSSLGDLAFSAESNNHILGPVRNPFDLSRTAGGSTGGGAAAVATGMAAFDWGTDFGGSIRTPAAFCGIVGLRLSNAIWPVNQEHFPRIPKRFWPMCGMGPLTRTVAGARRLVEAMSELRVDSKTPAVDGSRVVIYGPDASHRGEWPTFVGDATRLLIAAKTDFSVDRSLPSPSAVNELFNAYLCSHYEELITSEEMSIREGIGAVLLGLASQGRLDKRIHPNTGILFGLIAVGGLVRYRDGARYDDELEQFRNQVRRVWDSGALIVTPTCSISPPKHNRAAFAHSIQTFTKFGNLTDATGIALPAGRFANGLPRSLQIMGPPGSEMAVLRLAEQLETAQTRLSSPPSR